MELIAYLNEIKKIMKDMITFQIKLKIILVETIDLLKRINYA